MSTNTFEHRLELNQGVGFEGRVFGYDHENCNFVVWNVVDGRIVIHKIEHDDTEEQCGPIEDTREVAERFLANENRIQYRTLLASCKAGFARP